ncbi:MAG: hypothetical protein QXF23_06775 [Candidatus Bathyarchaeia archaeon]
MLIKENNTFRGTEDSINFYKLLRDVRGKLEKFIGWAVLYLRHLNGLRNFYTPGLVNLISYSDEELIVNLTDRLLANDEHFSIRYPSNSFIIRLLEKISKLKISSLYDRYSYFVHSYDKTWQFYPFSSVVEFEIFKHELDRFIKLLRGVFDFYEKEMLLKEKM